MTVLGAIFSPDQPPEHLKAVARAADAAGLEQLWVWEDCFKESGIATAAAVLGWTERLAVGIGLLPVPLRNVALTAMELATLERLFPGRVMPGVGHGVLDWMSQVGARADSPMTLLREYTAALRALLHGETVTTAGHYVHLDAVALDWPPQAPPPLLVGAVRPKTVEVAGQLADGVLLTGETGVEQVRVAVPAYTAAREAAGHEGPGLVQLNVTVPDDEPAERTAERIVELAGLGVTHASLLPVGDGRPLVQFVAHVAERIRPLVP